MQLIPPLKADKSLYDQLQREFEMVVKDAAGASEEEDQQDHFLNYDGELVEARECLWGIGRGAFYN